MEFIHAIAKHGNWDIDLMKAVGIGWVRTGFPYPFMEPEMETLSRDYLRARVRARRWAAADLRATGVIVVALHPGWVRTGMGGSQASMLPADAVRQMLAVIDGLTLADTSKFFTCEGREFAW